MRLTKILEYMCKSPLTRKEYKQMKKDIKFNYIFNPKIKIKNKIIKNKLILLENGFFMENCIYDNCFIVCSFIDDFGEYDLYRVTKENNKNYLLLYSPLEYELEEKEQIICLIN